MLSHTLTRLLCALGAAAATVQASQTFSNTGTMSGWEAYTRENKGTVQEVTNVVYKGTTALKMTQVYTPGYTGRYHSEAVKYNVYKKGDTGFYGFAFRLQEDWEFSGGSYNIAQFIADFTDLGCEETYSKQSRWAIPGVVDFLYPFIPSMPSDPIISIPFFLPSFPSHPLVTAPPVLAWGRRWPRNNELTGKRMIAVPSTLIWIDGNRLSTRVKYGNVCPTSQQQTRTFSNVATVTAGAWHRVELQVSWKSDSTGYFKLWFDGQKVSETYNIPTNVGDGRPFQFRVGLYANGWHDSGYQGSQATRQIWYDQISAGSVFADADPGAW